MRYLKALVPKVDLADLVYIVMKLAASAATLLLVGTANALPPWTWDTMQSYVHCANMSGAWAPWAADVLAEASFVVFEKWHGMFASPANTSAETKIAAACAQVKEASARSQSPTDCYIYVEVDWARTVYTLGHDVDANLATLGMHWSNGSAFGNDAAVTLPNKYSINDTTTFHYHWHGYDFRAAAMQKLWAARITDAVATGHVDGAFIDGNRGGWNFKSTSACAKGDKTCVSELQKGLEEAHRTVAQTLGRDATLISNYPTPEALAVTSGGMCERCGHGAGAVVSLRETYYANDMTCGLWNQPCVLQYRCYGNNGQHGSETITPYQDIANQSIATFLMAMEKYAYYGGGSESGVGPQACNMSDGSFHFLNWPDLKRPLGNPLGVFKNVTRGSDHIFTRVFATGTRVAINATMASSPHDESKDNYKCIWWSDGFTTGGANCPAKTAVEGLFSEWKS